MRVYMVNEGTLRKPQGPCYAFAVFLQLKEVHLFSVKSHCVTANWEYFKSIMNKHKISPVSESAPVTFGQRFCERNPKHQASLSAWNTTGWGSSPCTEWLHLFRSIWPEKQIWKRWFVWQSPYFVLSHLMSLALLKGRFCSSFQNKRFEPWFNFNNLIWKEKKALQNELCIIIMPFSYVYIWELLLPFRIFLNK